MKTPAFILAATLATALAEDFSIEWSEMSPGGTSAGADYWLTGGVSPLDAGPMTGGEFALSGVIQSVLGVEPPAGAPALSFTRGAGNAVVLSWPYPSEGWVLERAAGLEEPGSGWSPVPLPWATNATSVFVIEPIDRGHRFYRLRAP